MQFIYSTTVHVIQINVPSNVGSRNAFEHCEKGRYPCNGIFPFSVTCSQVSLQSNKTELVPEGGEDAAELEMAADELEAQLDEEGEEEEGEDEEEGESCSKHKQL